MLPIPKIFEKINHQPEEAPPFLALMIGRGKVKSSIWVFEEGQGKVLTFGSLEKWSGDSPEELVVAADTSIGSAVAKLSTIFSDQPNKVVLGLPEEWVSGNSVKEAESKILQTICRKLLLKPQGFVVNPEAITHFLKNKEGELLSVILIELEESEIVVSLVVQGKNLGSQVVSRSNNLALDLEEGLIRFNYSGPLPPRILLIDGEELEEAKQTLVAYPWISPEKQKKVSFLQFPRVDFAPENLEVEAVVFAGSREIAPVGKEVEAESETTKEVDPQTLVELSLPNEDFGFVKNKDIFLDLTEPLAEIPLPIKPEQGEVLEKQPLEINKSKIKLAIKLPSFFKKIPEIVKKVISKTPRRISVGKAGSPKKALFGFGLGFLVVFGFLLFSYLQIVKAEVNLQVKPATVETEIQFTISDQIDQPNISKKILPAKNMTTEVSGSMTAAVQGRKTIGEKAKGEVVIYNGTDQKKTFSKQAIIFGFEDLSFVLDEEITVPARTTDINSSPPVDKWGEARVAVTAKEIGAQYNLPAGANLSLDSHNATGSAFLVRNTTEFSGGTSREISAVSKQDLESLRENLLTELKNQAETSLKEKVSQTNLLPDSLKLESKAEQFNHEINDEASELSLELKATYSVSYFRQEDLEDLIKQATFSLVPEGFNSEPYKQDQEFSLHDLAKKQYLAQVVLQFFPNIPIDQIPTKLKGKFVSQSKKILSETKNVSGYEIKVTPQIFSIFPLLPLKSKNIVVKMSSL